MRLCALFNAALTTPSSTEEGAPASNDWVGWLALADRYRLPRLLPLAAGKALDTMTALPTSDDEAWKAEIVGLGTCGLSAGTWQLLFEGLAKAASSFGKDAKKRSYNQELGSLNTYIPKTFKSWSKPGDLF